MTRTIYLCGPINGCTDAEARNWRELVKERWDGQCLDPMRRDYRGREQDEGVAQEIVDGDIDDLKASDAILVYFDKPSVGTSAEVVIAKRELGKFIVVIDAQDKPLSPWLTHHVDLVTRDVGVALAVINMELNRKPAAPAEAERERREWAEYAEGFMHGGG